MSQHESFEPKADEDKTKYENPQDSYTGRCPNQSCQFYNTPKANEPSGTMTGKTIHGSRRFNKVFPEITESDARISCRTDKKSMHKSGRYVTLNRKQKIKVTQTLLRRKPKQRTTVIPNRKRKNPGRGDKSSGIYVDLRELFNSGSGSLEGIDKGKTKTAVSIGVVTEKPEKRVRNAHQCRHNLKGKKSPIVGHKLAIDVKRRTVKRKAKGKRQIRKKNQKKLVRRRAIPDSIARRRRNKYILKRKRMTTIPKSRKPQTKQKKNRILEFLKFF